MYRVHFVESKLCWLRRVINIAFAMTSVSGSNYFWETPNRAMSINTSLLVLPRNGAFSMTQMTRGLHSTMSTRYVHLFRFHHVGEDTGI